MEPVPGVAEDKKTSPPNPTFEEKLDTWNGSRTNSYRFFVTLWSFIIMGMNDAAIGALIPYIEAYYNITYTVVALLFLSPFVGYLMAALSNNLIHHKLGQRGIAVLGPVSRIIGYVPLALHPPYPALPAVLLFAGFGTGLEDSAWNAWVGNMQNANELLGILHGAYGLGATIGFITGRIGEKRAIAIYLLLSIALELFYWLVPNFVASVIFVALLGFFLGPLFPAAIVAATKLLPNDYHVSAIGFAAAFGGGGAAIFPFAIGAIAQKKGVQVLQPIILAILVFILLLWLCLPGGMRRGGLERARENKEGLGIDVKNVFRWIGRRPR
ncbi:Bypass of stop codon protein 6, partial [Colletotrichum shisoi]